MKQQASFAGWDFVGETANGQNDIWTIRENRDYPRLQWQQLYVPNSRSIIKNGSFEADGYINDISAEAPQYWCDVSLPANKFYGYVDSDWGTQGYGTEDPYSLTIFSYKYGTFAVNDTGAVSQQVYFEEDVNELIFDVKLATSSGVWDPAKRTALVIIDGNEVWESNSVGTDVRGEYLDQSYVVEDKYKDGNPHTLSLALRANVSGTPYIYYYAQWDFIKFDKYCGGFGYLPEDFDGDCYVDTSDLRVLAEAWLTEVPGQRCDLSGDGVIDFKDFSFFANYWKANSFWENWGNSNCYAMELLLSDIDDSGEVDYGDILMLADDWLNTGDCIRADLNFDGVVDFKDFAVLAGDWRQKSWLYWVN
jgi:hypothetical protein